jgi:hypothetical protein
MVTFGENGTITLDMRKFNVTERVSHAPDPPSDPQTD